MHWGLYGSHLALREPVEKPAGRIIYDFKRGFMIRGLLLDDKASIRGEMRRLLELEEERGGVGEEEECWEAPDGEEAILSPCVIRPHSSTPGCGKFPSGQKPPIGPQNMTSPTACPISAALESLLPTQAGLLVQRIPPLAPGDLIPWSRPQDVAPLPAYCTRSTVFIRTHMQGEPKPFSALWGFGVPGGVKDSGHDSCNNNK